MTRPTTPNDTADKLQRVQEAAKRKGIKVRTAPELEADLQPQAAGIQAELLTCKEAAQLAGCGERTWWSWSRSGLAPKPVFIGHGTRPACRYRRSEIMDWIADGCPRCDGKGDNQR